MTAGYRSGVKCDVCKEREATVHDSAIHAGKIVERHLCEACAAGAGVHTPSGTPPASPEAAPPGKGRAAASPTHCPACRWPFSQFKEGGLLGCAECYRAFQGRLLPMLERYHEGGSHHQGKKPKRAWAGRDMEPIEPTPAPATAPPRPTRPTMDDTAKRIAVLRGQLASAISAEEYEKAARIRDELRRLGDPNFLPPAGGGGPA